MSTPTVQDSKSAPNSFPMGRRGVELDLVRQGLPIAAVITAIGLVAGWFVAGSDGLISAAIGGLLGFGNLYVSAIVLDRVARIGPNALMAGVLGSFVFRLIALTIIFVVLREFDFTHVPVLGFVLLATHMGVLIAEAIVVTRSDLLTTEVVLPKVTTRSAIDGADSESE